MTRRKKSTAPEKPAPATRAPAKGCAGRLLMPLALLFGGCMVLSVIFTAVQSAGERVGLLPARTPAPTGTLPATPSITPPATATPPTKIPSAAVPPTATVLPVPAASPAPLVQRSSAPVLESAPPAAFTVGGWNVGLDDADPQVIAQLLADFGGVDLWGLAEVNPSGQVPDLFAQAAESGEPGAFTPILGSSGDNIRLLALYDEARFDLVGTEELHEVNTTGNARAPLVLHLKEQGSGQELLFMVNHLYRSRDEERLRQAQLLAGWAARQTLPVIAVGDYNFDWALSGGEADHDPAYDAMVAGGAWEWIRPQELVTTQCSGWPCTYNSVLDFVFAGGPAREWPARSVIAVVPGDFPDDSQRSDHRAVLAQFAPGGESELGGEIVTVPAAMPQGVAVAQAANGQWLALANGSWILAELVTGAPAGLPVVVAAGEAAPQDAAAASEPGAVEAPAAPEQDRAAEPAFSATATPAPSPSEAVVGAPAAGVVISRILYDGEVPDVESDEYIELVNQGSAQVNLGGWRINAGDEGQDFWLPDYQLMPGGLVRVYTNETHPEFGGLSFSSGKPVWLNKRDCGYLFDANGAMVSDYCY
jgi:endonuclease/exonuclease/phosphatase family metal-dependent hydrolase